MEAGTKSKLGHSLELKNDSEKRNIQARREGERSIHMSYFQARESGIFLEDPTRTSLCHWPT